MISGAIDRDRAMRAERRGIAEFRSRYRPLTPREQDVMAHIITGVLNKPIAGELGTSEATVKEQRVIAGRTPTGRDVPSRKS